MGKAIVAFLAKSNFGAGFLKLGPAGLIAPFIIIVIALIGLYLARKYIAKGFASLLMALLIVALLIVGGTGLVLSIMQESAGLQTMNPTIMIACGSMLMLATILTLVIYFDQRAKEAAAERERQEQLRIERERKAELERRAIEAAAAREARATKVKLLASGVVGSANRAVATVRTGAMGRRLGRITKVFRRS